MPPDEPRSPTAERDERTFLAEVESEVARARDMFPTADHMYAALAEEVGEVAKALLEDGDVAGECVQVAAMATRLATEGDNDFRPADSPRPEERELREALRWIRERAESGNRTFTLSMIEDCADAALQGGES